MELRSAVCFFLSTLATLHVCLAESASLTEDTKPAFNEERQVSIDDDSLSEKDKRKWAANFHSWGKKWSDFGTWGKKWASSKFPTWGKKWGSDQGFTSWGKRNAAPATEEQKRNWNQFITWGKRDWHTMNSWGKRSHDKEEESQANKKWKMLSTWGKRSGWDSGFASWGKRDSAAISDKLIQFFDGNGDGMMDTKELNAFLNWMNKASNMAEHP